MLKTVAAPRIHLVAAARVSRKPADPAIRRYRLARLRIESRPADIDRPGRAQGA